MHINILGYGLMAKQIAALFHIGGHSVSIWNHQKIEPEDLGRQIRLLKKFIEPVSFGEISFVDRIEELEDNFTIESVVEDIDVKIALYQKLKGVITKGYCTNTSSYSPGEIGPEVLGLHFFNPITLKLIEYYNNGIALPAVDEVIGYLEERGFDVVPVGNNRGYIGNYILFHEISSAMKLIEKYNYTVESVNSFYKKLYNGRDVFAIIDLIGIDVVQAIIINLKVQDDTLYLPSSLQKAIDSGVLGRKNKTSIKQVLP